VEENSQRASVFLLCGHFCSISVHLPEHVTCIQTYVWTCTWCNLRQCKLHRLL